MMQRTLETLSLFALLSVVVLRPIVSESYDSAQNPLTASLSAVADPTPLRTLVFDLVILVGCAGWLISRAIGPVRRYRRTGLEWGLLLVGLAAIISCFAAGQKRLAINASIDWLCYPILAIALVQLMVRPWHRRVLLAAVLATACVQTFLCLEQSLVGYEETWAHYESIKTEYWAQQGVSLDSPMVESFERRIKSGEASGGLYHSNVTGSYLVLCAMAALGLVVGVWRGRLEPARLIKALCVTALAVFMIVATVTTNSLGAAMSGAAGIVLWIGLYWRRSWINAHRKKAVMLGWVLASAGVVGVIGHGLYHDSLPGWSLTFRWQWWKASAELVKDHLLTGVGRENFRREYLAYKSIESPEEVANPHNLGVQAAADFGVLGLVGILVMMVGASRTLSRPVQIHNQATAGRDPPSMGRLGLWALALGVVVVFGRIPLLGTEDPNFLYYASITTAMVWLFGFLVVASGLAPLLAKEGSGEVSYRSNNPPQSPLGKRGGKSSHLSSRASNGAMISDSGTSPTQAMIAMGVGVGLFTFVLHDMINFAFFVPGTATTFFALLAYGVAERGEDDAESKPASPLHRWVPIGGLLVAVVLVAITGLIPVARSNAALQKARASAGAVLPVDPSAQLPYQYFQQAAIHDPYDPTPLADCAMWLIRASQDPEFAQASLALADDSLTQAIDRDPSSLTLRRMRIGLYQRLAQIDPTEERFYAAIQAAEQALALYPQDPHGFVRVGDRQFEAGTALRSSESLRAAVDSYRQALELDDRRLWWEKLQRFGDLERQSIEERMDQALARISHHKGTKAPRKTEKQP